MLTFSSGPHFKNTPALLDILKEKKVKATFFAVGSKAIHRWEMLKRIHNEGHEIGSNGFYQTYFTKIKQDQLLAGIVRANQAIMNSTSADVKYCRPPNGISNAQINQFIKDKTKMKIILWSLDSKDLEERSPEVVTSNVIKRAKPGDVVLFHDTQNVTVLALPAIIDGLHKDGYEFLTISQVLSFPDDSPH